MSFLINALPTINNITQGLLNRYPVICEKFPGFCNINVKYFADYQRDLLIGTLAATALTTVGGLYGMVLNSKGSLGSKQK